MFLKHDSTLSFLFETSESVMLPTSLPNDSLVFSYRDGAWSVTVSMSVNEATCGTWCCSRPSLRMSDAHLFFCHPSQCQFLWRVQCVPLKNIDTYPPLLPGAVWTVCLFFFSLCSILMALLHYNSSLQQTFNVSQAEPVGWGMGGGLCAWQASKYWLWYGLHGLDSSAKWETILNDWGFNTR